jgi:hypothetical protein
MNSETTSLISILISMGMAGALTMAYYVQRALIDPNRSFMSKKIKM